MASWEDEWGCICLPALVPWGGRSRRNRKAGCLHHRPTLSPVFLFCPTSPYASVLTHLPHLLQHGLLLSLFHWVPSEMSPRQRGTTQHPAIGMAQVTWAGRVQRPGAGWAETKQRASLAPSCMLNLSRFPLAGFSTILLLFPDPPSFPASCSNCTFYQNVPILCLD